MLKSLLVLMLMTTQLLAGGGGSLYVCISQDGSFACIDSGPETCERCSDRQVGQHGSCCHGHAEQAEKTCHNECAHDCHPSDETPTTLSYELPSSDACGCVHIPLMLSSIPSIKQARISPSMNGEPLGCAAELLPFFDATNHAAAVQTDGRWCAPRIDSDFGLALISVAVMRC